VKVAAVVAGHDELESVGKRAAKRSGIAGNCGQDFSGLQVPYLHRFVIRSRDGALPVRTATPET
jgi:hypothetical protein